MTAGIVRLWEFPIEMASSMLHGPAFLPHQTQVSMKTPCGSAQWGSLQDPRRGRFLPPIARFCSLTRVLFSSKPRHSVVICLIEILDFDNNSSWPVL